MPIDRSQNTLGNSATQVSVAWENDFQTDLNNLKSYVADIDMVAGFMQGLDPVYTSASQIQIKSGQAISDSGTQIIKISSPITVDLTVSGVGGLDTGSEANSTWYYVWAIAKTDLTASVIFSTSSTSPTLPSGYTVKRILPFAFRNDSSGNIIKFSVANGWPSRPHIIYQGNDLTLANGSLTVLNAGTATTFTSVNLSTRVPPISKVADVLAGSASTSSTITLRTTGESDNGQQLVGGGQVRCTLATNASQQIDYKGGSGAVNHFIHVAGFIITDVNGVTSTSSGVTSVPLSKTGKGFIGGLESIYIDSNTVRISTGRCRDDSDYEDIEVTSTINVSLAASGTNGLDTGSEANSTWYYVWVIKNSSTGDVRGLFSLSSTSPTLPSGYDRKRLLPIAVRNDSSGNIIPYNINSGWPNKPLIMYDVSMDGTTISNSVLSAGTATSFTDVDASSFVPPVSRECKLYLSTSTGSNSAYVRNKDYTHNGKKLYFGAANAEVETSVQLSSSNVFQYRVGSGNTSIGVLGFTVTEIPSGLNGSGSSSGTGSSSFPAKFLAGPHIQWTSVSSVTIPANYKCRSSDNTTDITFSSNAVVSIASSGVNGLDTGSEASNTWYYLYAIYNPSTLTTAGLLSTVNESVTGSVTLPSGYTKKRQLPIAIRNNGSSNFYSFFSCGCNKFPFIQYTENRSRYGSVGTLNLQSGTASTSFTDYDVSGFVPPISTITEFQLVINSGGGTYLNIGFRLPGGSETNGTFAIGGESTTSMVGRVQVSSTQHIELSRVYGTAASIIDVSGFMITSEV